MTRSKPFHQFKQESCSPYGFLAEPNVNVAFSNRVTRWLSSHYRAALSPNLSLELERQAVWLLRETGLPAALLVACAGLMPPTRVVT
jgi:hypothetical protein